MFELNIVFSRTGIQVSTDQLECMQLSVHMCKQNRVYTNVFLCLCVCICNCLFSLQLFKKKPQKNTRCRVQVMMVNLMLSVSSVSLNETLIVGN